MRKTIHEHEGKKYLRRIMDAEGKMAMDVDVYCVIEAFRKDNPVLDLSPIQHALKKLLAPGRRGKGDVVADLNGVLAAVNRAIDILDQPEFPSNPQLKLTGGHLPTCGIKFRGCDPNCPKELKELREVDTDLDSDFHDDDDEDVVDETTGPVSDVKKSECPIVAEFLEFTKRERKYRTIYRGRPFAARCNKFIKKDATLWIWLEGAKTEKRVVTFSRIEEFVSRFKKSRSWLNDTYAKFDGTASSKKSTFDASYLLAIMAAYIRVQREEK